MSRLFGNKNKRDPSISSISSSQTRGSNDTALAKAIPIYSGEEMTEKKGSVFVKRMKDMRSRWTDIMNVDDLLESELKDTRLHPEIQYSASIRRSNDLCAPEATMITARRKRAVKQLRRFLKIPDDEEVDWRDVPIIGLGGSGGGFRAMLGFAATMEAVKEAGMWDLVMYTAGVSGSCWALGAYYTWGEMSTKRVLNHFAKHSTHHPLSPKAMRETMKSPRGPYYLLAPLQQKHLGGLKQTLMDVYGSFVTAYLWMPTKEEAINIWRDRSPTLHREWFRWSAVAPKITKGEEPLPILTAIRHERPWKAWKDKDSPFSKEDHNDKEHREAINAWWQWYEFTPFEFGCDELKYWIPIWGFGRPFDSGISTKNLPEHSLSSILGLCTSAPAAPMSIYLGTIQRMLPKGWVEGSIDNIGGAIAHLWGKHDTKVFEGAHPIHAANEHNPLYHATPSPRPPGIENAERIHLLDSGISNNCPTYPFMHPSRGMDVMLSFDASSDVASPLPESRTYEFGEMKGIKFIKRSLDKEPTAHKLHSSDSAASVVDTSIPQPSDTQPSVPLDENAAPRNPEPDSSNPPGSVNGHDDENQTAIDSRPSVNSSRLDGSTAHLNNSNGSRYSSTVGKSEKQKDEADAKKKAQFEADKLAEPKAEDWTPEYVEKKYGGRYSQIFDGYPTNPPHPIQSQSKQDDIDSTLPAMAHDQQPGSIPYNISEHNVPLATRPVTLVYMPLFPNKVMPNYDPSGAPWSGSYNLKWTEEQVQTIRATAKANFRDGLDNVRLTIKEAYNRRKAERLGTQRHKQDSPDVNPEGPKLHTYADMQDPTDAQIQEAKEVDADGKPPAERHDSNSTITASKTNNIKDNSASELKNPTA